MMALDSAMDRYYDLTLYGGFYPKVALIDMDGTLYDSMPAHSKAWHRLMTELGITCTPQEFLMYEGMTGEATIKMLMKRDLGREVSTEEARELYRRKTEYFSELPEVHPMPGAREMLDTLKREGMRCVLVTGSGQRSVIDRVYRDFPGAFEEGMEITSRDVTRGKPHPEPYLKGMEKASVNAWNCIVIENAPLGVESGVRAGAFTFGVKTGPLPENALEDAGAYAVFPSMAAFAAALPTLLEELRHYKYPMPKY